jgi:MoxR-like ATPase
MQNVLEGKPFLIKKINKVVKPVAGFNIIATANTKGQGDLTGKFVNTNVLNEAFLERFAVALEQEYPPSSVEEKIVKNNLSLLDLEDDDFAVKLVKWAGTNRETFKAGGINEVIATRRLVHIVKAYSMFDKNRIKAVEICLNRFDDESKGALLDLWKKIDATPVPDAFAKTASNTTSAPNSNATQSDPNTVPF